LTLRDDDGPAPFLPAAGAPIVGPTPRRPRPCTDEVGTVHPLRRTIRLALGGGLLALAAAGPASAAAPQVYTWEKDVDAPYFDCGSFVANGVWHVSHVLTIYVANDGTPIRDREKVEFTGGFVNHDTGASIGDSGQSIWFDTLDADGSFLTTMLNTVRRSDYFTFAGRVDFQTGAHHGVDRFDVNIPAACAALGG
jgi:hypothetical protein